MHPVRQLKQLLLLAQQAGYQIRQEWLEGVSFAGCRLGGRKLLFVDLALETPEQVEQVAQVLLSDPEVDQHRLAQILGSSDKQAA